MEQQKMYLGYVLIAPNMAFDSPIREIPTYDKDDIQNGTKFISIREDFATEASSGISNRVVKPLLGGTHSYGVFAMSSAKGDFEKNKALMAHHGLVDGLVDFTSTAPNVAYMLNYEELQEFLKVSPLNQIPVVEEPV